MQSVWMVDADRNAHRYPTLSGNLDVDTVVVGGGITGVTTAWLLSEAGQRVALLEAHELGSGSTGRSTGNLYGTVSSGLAAMRSRWPGEVVRQMVALRLQAMDWLEQIVSTQGIDCAFARRPLCAAVAGEDAASLQDEFDATAEAGLEPRWMDARELPSGTTRAFRIERQAQFNPYACVHGLADALARRGVQVCEHSAVAEVNPDRHCVATAQGRVKARHIVLATHTPLGMNLIQAEMPVYRECAIAATLTHGPYPEGIFWIRDASLSVRGHRDCDGRDYLVVVGQMHKPGHEQASQYEALRNYARERFPVAQFTHAWSAQQYRSADTLPYIGRSGHDNVLVATGFNADGLTWGTAAARIISELVIGVENPTAERLSPGRFTPVKSAKAWMAESKVVFDHLIKHRLSGKGEEDLWELEAGEGQPPVRRPAMPCSSRHSPAPQCHPANCGEASGPPPRRWAASGRKRKPARSTSESRRTGPWPPTTNSGKSSVRMRMPSNGKPDGPSMRSPPIACPAEARGTAVSRSMATDRSRSSRARRRCPKMPKVAPT